MLIGSFHAGKAELWIHLIQSGVTSRCSLSKRPGASFAGPETEGFVHMPGEAATPLRTPLTESMRTIDGKFRAISAKVLTRSSRRESCTQAVISD
jgi:hypothetical protein